MKKWIVGILLILICVIGYNYVYQNHRNILAEIPEFALTSKALKREFVNNLSASKQKYLNKTLTITGEISEGTTTEITLDSSVFCQFIDSLNATLKEGSKIKIKGRVIGYDDLLEQVKLDQCSIIN